MVYAIHGERERGGGGGEMKLGKKTQKRGEIWKRKPRKGNKIEKAKQTEREQIWKQNPEKGKQNLEREIETQRKGNGIGEENSDGNRGIKKRKQKKANEIDDHKEKRY